MRDCYYDVALICMNGHLINDCSNTATDHNSEYCKHCGAKCIDACLHCGEKIKGHYHVAGFFSSSYTIPKFCGKCGNPYPWTEAEMQAAKELIELSDLGEADKESFKSAIEDIIVDTPKTKVAGAKIKIYLSRIGEEIRKDIKDILIGIGTEVALEQMGLRRK